MGEKLAWRARRLLLAQPSNSSPQVRAVAPGPIIVAGLLSTASGIGQSARACVAGLRRSGLDPVCIDLSEAFQQVDLPPFPGASNMPETDGGAVIVHLNPPEFERGCFLLNLWRGHSRRVIGYWAWELPQIPSNWSKYAKLASEIWVPSQFTASAFPEAMPCPVRIVPHHVTQSASAPVGAVKAQDGVVCLSLGDGHSSFERKNLLASVRVFKAAKGASEASLIVKARNLSKFPEFAAKLADAIAGDAHISIIEDTLTESEMTALFERADILLSLHRCEGFGLAIAEAMSSDVAVIATGWSGNVDFAGDETQILVPYSLTPVDDPFQIYPERAGMAWAEPDEAAAARALTKLIEDEALRAEMTARARAHIAPWLQGAAYVKALGLAPET